ncbi:hypothetical protein TNCV_3915561 [Trichonephila clavipes]|nr:hypothetical protein TNCV_3915561 [Trichonephila clavipes]
MVSWWLEHQTPDWKACVRCPMPKNTLRVHTEYVLVKPVGGLRFRMKTSHYIFEESLGCASIAFIHQRGRECLLSHCKASRGRGDGPRNFERRLNNEDNTKLIPKQNYNTND